MALDPRLTRDDTPAPDVRGLAPDERARLLEALRDVPTPQRIGHFAVIGELGRGGMGAVYEAEQDHPRRRVALKVIHPGLVSRAMLRRFKHEADVLARLAHPGIARVYEAGVADAGAGPQPYFAMELVRGRPLDTFVRETNPSTTQRLKLLIAICDAMHHAHTKGIIHRDLKPSNILVTPDGQPKVLDFGVARAIDRDGQVTTLHTESGLLVGTLLYMSPEQASGKVEDVDASSDVYALGMIAYELLSGRMPYCVAGRSLLEAVRLICHEEPSRLSSIDKRLRGDVETIVGKALEKDRSRRYPTAGELAADVRRYLDYEPISARRPGTWDQLHKFARRNRALVLGAGVVLLVLLAGTGVSTYLAVVASRERAAALDKQREAEAVVAFLTHDVLAAATPERARDATLTDAMVRVMLEPAAAAVGRRFAARPLVEAAVRDTLASCYHALGRADLGLPHARWALERRRALQGPDHPETLTSLNNLASLWKEQGEFVKAEPMFRELLDRRRRVLGGDDPETLHALANLADLLYARDALDEAERLSRDALERRRAVRGNDHAETLASLNNLARVLADRGKLAEAGPLYREALATSRRTLGADHPYTFGLLSNLASLAAAQGDQAEAEALQREALAQRRRVLGDDHRDTITSMNNLAVSLYNQGKLDEAEPLLRELPERYARVLGERHPQTLTSLSNLGSMLQNRGKLKDAEPVFAELYRRSRDAPIETAQVAEYAALYGVCLVKLSRYEQAEQPLRDAAAGLPDDDSRWQKSRRNVLEALAVMCEKTGRTNEATGWRDELERLGPASRSATTSRGG